MIVAGEVEGLGLEIIMGGSMDMVRKKHSSWY